MSASEMGCFRDDSEINKITKRIELRIKNGRSHKTQQGRSNKKLQYESRNKKQEYQPSVMQLVHMNLWNEQDENQQHMEFQMSPGNQHLDRSNRLQHQKINRGLSKKKLNLLPKIKADSQHVAKFGCPICIEEYKKKQPLMQLYCGHVFHIKCGKKWLETSTKCPICKRDQLKK